MVILIVDDDPGNRELLGRMVRHLGWLSDEAIGGYQAIEACKSAHYDVVLLDLNMPDMSGREAARAIRAIPEPPALAGARPVGPTRIVVVTGADTTTLGNKELFDDVLPKPFVISDLKRVLERMKPS